MTELAEKIKEVAKNNGTSMTELAAKLKVTQPAMSRKINNPRITMEDLERIAKEIGCKVADFLEEKKEESKDRIICPHCGKVIKFGKEDG